MQLNVILVVLILIQKSFEILKSKSINPIDQTQLDTDPKSNPIDLVQSALRGDNIESNNRYLLLLTENYAILDIIQNYLLNIVKIENHNLMEMNRNVSSSVEFEITAIEPLCSSKQIRFNV